MSNIEQFRRAVVEAVMKLGKGAIFTIAQLVTAGPEGTSPATVRAVVQEMLGERLVRIVDAPGREKHYRVQSYAKTTMGALRVLNRRKRGAPTNKRRQNGREPEVTLSPAEVLEVTRKAVRLSQEDRDKLAGPETRVNWAERQVVIRLPGGWGFRVEAL